MWLPANIVAAVDEVATLHYVGRADCKRWNDHRRDGELRLLSGWCWTAKHGRGHRQGYKTLTAAYRDCWYVLVQHTEAPSTAPPRLRLVARKAA